MTLDEYLGLVPRGTKMKFTKQIADKVGVSSETVRAWSTGIRRPRLEHAIEIEQLTEGKVSLDELRPDLFKK